MDWRQRLKNKSKLINKNGQKLEDYVTVSSTEFKKIVINKNDPWIRELMDLIELGIELKHRNKI